MQLIKGKNHESLNSIILPYRAQSTIVGNLRRDSDFAIRFKKLGLQKRDQQLSIREDFKQLNLNLI
jgi:hypothetical protein